MVLGDPIRENAGSRETPSGEHRTPPGSPADVYPRGSAPNPGIFRLSPIAWQSDQGPRCLSWHHHSDGLKDTASSVFMPLAQSGKPQGVRDGVPKGIPGTNLGDAIPISLANQVRCPRVKVPSTVAFPEYNRTSHRGATLT